MHLREQTRGLTGLLDQVNGGQEGAFARVVDAVYDDIKRIAGRRMKDRFAQPGAALTLPPTAIAHDAIMELRRQRERFRNADHFFAIAARLIDHLISDYQKRRACAKRGG